MFQGAMNKDLIDWLIDRVRLNSPKQRREWNMVETQVTSRWPRFCCQLDHAFSHSTEDAGKEKYCSRQLNSSMPEHLHWCNILKMNSTSISTVIQKRKWHNQNDRRCDTVTDCSHITTYSTYFVSVLFLLLGSETVSPHHFSTFKL